jgi:hypothetical protein
MKTYAIVSVVLISLVMVYMFVFRKKENYSSNAAMMYMQSLSQMSNVDPQINMLMQDSRNAISALENVNNTYAKVKEAIMSNASPMVQNTFSEFSATYFPNGSLTL